MPRFQNPTFQTVGLSELIEVVSAYKRQGLQFVQLCATTLEDSCDLLYAFSDPAASDPGLIGLKVNVADDAKVPSITDFYPAAFVFENETHDLFGIHIEGINIDFSGAFYTVAVKYPMNPRAAQAEAAREAAFKEAVRAEGAVEEADEEVSEEPARPDAQQGEEQDDE